MPLIELRPQSNRSKVTKDTECHVMPCKIHYSGKAKVSQYFHPTRQDDKRVVYFRGRKLLGTNVNLPEGYSGLVLKKGHPGPDDYEEIGDDRDDDEDERTEKVLDPSKGFQSLTVWGHEAPPDTTNDPFITGVTDWISVAHAIHDPIDKK